MIDVELLGATRPGEEVRSLDQTTLQPFANARELSDVVAVKEQSLMPASRVAHPRTEMNFHHIDKPLVRDRLVNIRVRVR